MDNQFSREELDKMGICFDGKYYSHPKTNTYTDVKKVIIELANWSPIRLEPDRKPDGEEMFIVLGSTQSEPLAEPDLLQRLFDEYKKFARREGTDEEFVLYLRKQKADDWFRPSKQRM